LVLALLLFAGLVRAVASDSVAVFRNAESRIWLLHEGRDRPPRAFTLPAKAGGVAIHGNIACVTTDEPAGRVLALDLATGETVREFPVGHTPCAPVFSPDGAQLFLALRFENAVVSLDLRSGAVRRVPVVREPVALALSPEGRRLFVANLLPEVRPALDDENPFIAAEVSAVDTASWQVIRNIELPNGSHSLRGIVVSPDGAQVAVVHILANYTRPTWTLEGGLMSRNVVSLIDARSLDWMATIPLDDPERGAANPWGVAFSDDGRQLLVTHAGTHELSVIDYPALWVRLGERVPPDRLFDPQELELLTGIRRRIALPVKGPRRLQVAGRVAVVTGHFSQDLARVDLGRPEQPPVRIPLGEEATPSLAERGELHFHDASLCFQQWQSCSTCHPDGRGDALYWDLLNDGVGNTKDTKSLLMATRTPPVMWRGVREDAGAAVRAGIHHIQFAEPTDSVADAIEAFLDAMPEVPGPALDSTELETPKTDDSSCAKCHYPGIRRGVLTGAAGRGKALFEGKAGCVECHPHPHFTNGQQVDPGLGSGVKYDVPSLTEVWRTAPYLHSGEALTLREAIMDHNLLQHRGHTKDLTEEELADLLAYVRSL
jgi:cytochrome c peroxidase